MATQAACPPVLEERFEYEETLKYLSFETDENQDLAGDDLLGLLVFVNFEDIMEGKHETWGANRPFPG